MALRINADRFFTKVIDVHSDEPGGAVQSFTATFKVLEDAAFSELPNTADGIREMLCATLVDAEGVIDAADKPVPFGAELLDWFLSQADIVAALQVGYIHGLGRARAGN